VSKKMRSLTLMLVGMLATQVGQKSNEAVGQTPDPETAAVMATAIRAVVFANVPGRVLVSTTISSVVDEHAADVVSEAVGGVAIEREAAFACATNPATGRIDKRTCLVDGGQLIEVRSVERANSAARVIVRLYTNEGAHAPTAREFRVDLQRIGVGNWRAAEKVLLEIT
jgi:hypothetical protein